MSYVVLASGGVAGAAETLRAVPRDMIRFGGDRLVVSMTARALEDLPVLADGDWPALAPETAA